MRRRGPFTTSSRGILRAGDADGLGVSRSTRATAVAGGQAIRPFRGVYLASGAVDEDSLLRAALAQLAGAAVAVIGSAAKVHGLEGLPRSWMPQVAMPRGLERAQREGMEIHFWTIPDEQVEVIDDVPVTTIARTLADACRLLTREQSVCLVDSALHRGLVSTDALAEVHDLMARRPNSVVGRRHLGLARAGAQSPGETRVRLILSDAGLPPDALQVPRRDREGRLLGYADLGYRLAADAWLLVEFDGRSIHERPHALLADRHRQNAILSAGSDRMVRFAWEDTLSRDVIPAVVRPILEQARWRPPTRPC